MNNKQNSNLRQEVALSDLRFYAHHGFYPEEQVLGNEFYVDVTLGFTPIQAPGDPEDLSKTVNYEVVYEIVRSAMATPRKLLETVCETILSQLRSSFPFIDDADVRIRKTHPPFGGDSAASTVRLIWNNKNRDA